MYVARNAHAGQTFYVYTHRMIHRAVTVQEVQQQLAALQTSEALPVPASASPPVDDDALSDAESSSMEDQDASGKGSKAAAKAAKAQSVQPSLHENTAPSIGAATLPWLSYQFELCCGGTGLSSGLQAIAFAHECARST